MDAISRQFQERERNLERALSSAASAVRGAREGGAQGPLDVECYKDAAGNWVAEARKPQGPQAGQADAFILRMDGRGRTHSLYDTEPDIPDQDPIAAILNHRTPLNLANGRLYASERVQQARARGEAGPLEVDCLQDVFGNWYCEDAQPRDPREGPGDVFILHAASRATGMRDAHDGMLTMFARGYKITNEEGE